ncbi:DUF1028 domain-containing protein [Maritalea mediterranea]|uniref:DUF1028 domain-containing protein n=1 Tax=Maritalea mediterranea TaxID=2909667 RepID=A0ABS9E8K7_9HYPH|nr:DUF1028 domain-containing protein [Maritalea mediterranea]MCF4099215.1 DUF1028 domain-containing protein [Maritalea mediterranea]
MTYSILVHDPETNQLGAAAATGSLCVGGWVLRGRFNVGLTASQGAAPSTFWRDDILDLLQQGTDVESAVEKVTSADKGRESRQLAALDSQGNSASFTGSKNTQIAFAEPFENGIVSGNLLADQKVLTAARKAYQETKGPMGDRLLSALHAAQDAGGDSRGLLSGALLVLSPDEAPLDLRVDYSEKPLVDLSALYQRAMTGDYRDWHLTVPTPNDKERGLD